MTEASTTLPIDAFVAAQEPPRIPDDATVNGTVFGETIKLIGHRWLEGNVLELYWQLLDEINGDWRVFAVVFDNAFQPGADNQIRLQKDVAPPLRLDHLHAGEAIVTRHAFDVGASAAGEGTVYVGWYDFAMGVRLTLPYPENMLPLQAFNFAPDLAR